MTVQNRANEIAGEFDFLDDWETRYAHIIDLGKANPSLAPEERTEQTRVRGCASQVWMILDEDEQGHLTIRAESDAMIVSGLIAVLIRLFSGAPREDIIAFDAPAFLEEIGVTGALSAQRSNGLNAMLERIRSAATAPSAAG